MHLPLLCPVLRINILCVSLGLGLVGCGDDDGGNGGTIDASPADAPAANPDTGSADAGIPPLSLSEIIVPGDNFFPEGIAVTSDGTFFTGSLTDGSIARLLAGETEMEIFVEPEQLDTAVGMIVDAELNLLWVCDAGFRGVAVTAVVGVSLADGTIAVRHPLPGETGLCNDLTKDAAGNLYATDSFGGRVIRVPADSRMEEGSAEEWATAPEWQVQPGEFGLNGLDLIGDTLYVAHTQNNAVYRVPVAADGSAGEVVEITLSRTPMGLDGMKAAADGSLIFVEGFANQLTRIALGANDQGELSTVASGYNGPATFAFFGDSVWVVEAQLEHLNNPKAGLPDLPFKIVRTPVPAELVP